MTSVLFKAVPNRLVVQLLYFVALLRLHLQGVDGHHDSGGPQPKVGGKKVLFHFAPGRRDLDKRRLVTARSLGAM